MAGIEVPIQVNLPDDWIEQIVNRLRNDPEAEWVEIVAENPDGSITAHIPLRALHLTIYGPKTEGFEGVSE